MKEILNVDDGLNYAEIDQRLDPGRFGGIVRVVRMGRMRFAAVSLGADGVLGTADDEIILKSW